jgi:3-methylcrotonyl-CoA carboxylase alpha subunit
VELTFGHGGRVVHVAGQRKGNTITVTTPDGQHTFEWQELRPGEYLLRAGAVQSRCVVARDGNQRWVWADGHVHHLRVESAAGRRDGAGSEAGPVSPMPGQILSVLIAPGENVRKGQALVIMEAMKMQYEIVAPRDGVVRRVHVANGQQVAGGVTLVELDGKEGA